MIYKEGLRKEITPRRLLSFLNLVTLGNYVKEEIKQLIYPMSLVKDQNIDFNRLFNFAKKICLIDENSQGRVYFIKNDTIKIIDGEIDEESYKEYMDEALFRSNESIFFNITNSLIKKNKEILKADNAEDFIKIVFDTIQITNEDILSWRFWAKYLGYVYNILDEFIVVNPYEYIHRVNKVIFKDSSNTGELMFGNYIYQLMNLVPILDGCIRGNNLSFPISLALLTLNDSGKIRLIYNNDSRDIWYLTDMPLSEIKQISHIDIGGNFNGDKFD